MLKIIKVGTDGTTGHMTFQAQVIYGEGNQKMTGPIETHGIDPLALRDRYNGDIQNFLDATHHTMLDRHERRMSAAKDLKKLEGTILYTNEEKQNVPDQT